MNQDPPAPFPPPRPCPRCGKPSKPDHRPFCSSRCADLDLGAWLNGDYRIATTDDDEEDGIGEDQRE